MVIGRRKQTSEDCLNSHLEECQGASLPNSTEEELSKSYACVCDEFLYNCAHVYTGIDDDFTDIARYLCHLNTDELEMLGRILGFSDATVTNYKESNLTKYRGSIIKAWLTKQDRVAEKGGPYWSTLEKALRDPLLGQNGIADKIRNEKLSFSNASHAQE